MSNSHGSRYEVRCLPESEHDNWDAFVEESLQGTIFSTTTWIKTFSAPFKLYGCYREGKLIGGLPVIEQGGECISGGPWMPLTQFQGILIHHASDRKYANTLALQNDVIDAFVEALEPIYKRIRIGNHPSLVDIRPFKWKGYTESVWYTSIVDLTDTAEAWNAMEIDTRRQVNKARKNGIIISKEDNIAELDRLYTATFERQEMERPITSQYMLRLYDALARNGQIQLYFGHNRDDVLSVANMYVWDRKRAYYLIGASNPQTRGDGASSLVMWTAFEDLSSRFNEIDLVGCNAYNIALFKRGFGGRLVPYFLVSKEIPKD